MIKTSIDLFNKANKDLLNYPEGMVRIPEMKPFGFFLGTAFILKKIKKRT